MFIRPAPPARVFLVKLVLEHLNSLPCQINLIILDWIDLKKEDGIGRVMKRYNSCGNLHILKRARHPDQERYGLERVCRSLGSERSNRAKLV